MDEGMPDILREFLESLSETDSAAVKEYLDNYSGALDKMLEIVA